MTSTNPNVTIFLMVATRIKNDYDYHAFQINNVTYYYNDLTKPHHPGDVWFNVDAPFKTRIYNIKANKFESYNDSHEKYYNSVRTLNNALNIMADHYIENR